MFHDGMDQRYFIGIDLAFSPRNNSGVAILEGVQADEGFGFNYIGSKLCKGDEEILEFIRPYLTSQSVIAMDAPLVVENATGIRGCERAIGRVFGGRKASAYPSNLGNMAGTRGPQLLKTMLRRGIQLQVSPIANRPPEGSVLIAFETYPHAAHLALFGIPEVWKYKKKSGRSWELCNRELALYWQEILTILPGIDELVTSRKGDPLGVYFSQWWPTVQEGGNEGSLLKGKRYKEFEDLTDGLFCAYAAYHLGVGRKGLLFSPDVDGASDLSFYKDGQDFILIPAK